MKNVYAIIFVFCVGTSIHAMKNNMSIEFASEFHFFTQLPDDIQNHIFMHELPVHTGGSFRSYIEKTAKRAVDLQLVCKENIKPFSIKDVAHLFKITNKNKDRFLLFAAHMGAPGLINLATRHEPNFEDVGVPTCCTALSIAVKKNHYRSCLCLLQAGADVNKFVAYYEGSCCRPLYIAAKEKNLKIMELLINYGADVNSGDYVNLKSPLKKAIQYKDFRMLKLLVDNGAIIPTCYKEDIENLFSKLTIIEQNDAQKKL